jgi:2',3'-cyclic-nucleotide 2'-phosphodiesterase (5'-nucleotidase family)
MRACPIGLTSTLLVQIMKEHEGRAMRRLATAAAVLAGLLLAVAGSAGARVGADAPGQSKKTGTTTIQLVTISDWHGQLEPFDVNPDPAVTTLGGGAAFLKVYFDQARAANPNTLTFMAGDSFGATPPIASFFDEAPAVQAMNMMGLSADTFGNHNFDKGVAHLQRMVDLADFPFVSANLKGLEENLSGVTKRVFFEIDGVRVAVIGITNEEAPELVFPGSFGTMELTDGVEAANKAAAQARKAGAKVVIILTHKGIRGFNTGGSAFGELVDFANEVDGDLIDVVVGDHTNFSYNQLHQGGKVLAVENLSKGAQFSKVQLTVDRATGVTAMSATQHTPTIAGLTPDAGIQAFIDDLNAQLAPILGRVVGFSEKPVLRSDPCGNADGRLCESLVGNVVTDALREAYGTDFAITNSGGLRDALTCPHVTSGGFCPTPPATEPPFPITRGGVIAVLRFGNISATTTLSGAEIKTFLERGVSAMPGANGRFAQVSGLCFTYDIEAAVGSRVTSIVRQAADGTCTGPAVDAGTNYTVTSNDFSLSGGDGYPNVISKSTTRNIMSQDLEAYVAAHSPINPTLQGRIVCTDPTPGTAPNCPTITP